METTAARGRDRLCDAGNRPDEVGRYLPGVLAVTPAEARARRGPAGTEAIVVIVGEASQFLGAVRRMRTPR
jgi:hypothetical protein